MTATADWGGAASSVLKLTYDLDESFWNTEQWVLIWQGRSVGEQAKVLPLVRKALKPGSNVDFPTITAICEVAAESEEDCKVATYRLGSSLVILSKSLLSSQGQHSNSPGGQAQDQLGGFDAQLCFKALTIGHEMLYDANAVTFFSHVRGFENALRVEEKFGKYFGYLARCEVNFCI